MCNGQIYWDYYGLVYLCFCQQNTAGFYCEIDAISYAQYMAGVMMLTTSNLAMIPAIVYGYNAKCFIEITSYAANMIASYIYHFCDTQYYCFNIPYFCLFVIDFILSYNSIVVGIIFLTRIQKKDLKFCLIFWMLVILMYIGIGNNFNGFVTGVLVKNI